MKQCYATTIFNIFNSRKYSHQYGIINEVANAINEYLSKFSKYDMRVESAKEVTLVDLQAIVLRHSSWFNYDLLQFIVDKCGKKDLLEKYLQGPLHHYLQLPIIDIPPQSYDFKGSMETHERELCYTLSMACNAFVLTGEDLRHIVTLLKEKLELSSLVLIGHVIKGESWTELHFGIPDKDDLKSSSFSYYAVWSEEGHLYNVTSDIL